MNLSWGVIPLMIEEKDNTDELFDHVVDVARQNNLVHNGDLVVITAGIPLGVSCLLYTSLHSCIVSIVPACKARLAAWEYARTNPPAPSSTPPK